MTKEKELNTESVDKKALLNKFLKVTNQESYMEILTYLMDSTKDLELKSEIHNPKELTILTLIEYMMELNGFTYGSDIIDKFLTIYLKYMVSKDRKGRTEIIHSLFYQVQEQLTQKERLKENFKSG